MPNSFETCDSLGGGCEIDRMIYTCETNKRTRLLVVTNANDDDPYSSFMIALVE